MDVFSDILSSLRLVSTVFAQTELAAPWGVSAGGREVSVFHVVLRGSCWLDVDGGEPLRVEAGDVVMVGPGRSHVLRDSPSTPPIPIDELLASGALARRPAGGPSKGEVTQIVCGCFHFEDERGGLLLSSLPPLVHLREMSHVGPWLEHTLELVSYESADERPGAQTVVNRLCDALFIYLVRSAMAAMPPAEPSFLRGLVDAQVGAALRLIHDRVDEAWTVGSLAAKVGMSRSAFAAKFTSVVGDTPMRYLAEWRLQKAAEMLRRGQDGVAEVAARVGYDSEAAFNKAFKRSIGVAPGAYRRSVRVTARRADVTRVET